LPRSSRQPRLYRRVRYRGNGEIIKRQEFEARKEAAEAAMRARLDKKPKKLSSAGRNLDGYPLLQVKPPSRGATILGNYDNSFYLQSEHLFILFHLILFHFIFFLRGVGGEKEGGVILKAHIFIFAQALGQREEAVRNGKLTTIVFIRDKNKRGQEVSGYIDYGQR
jgi:hypothetical protein